MKELRTAADVLEAARQQRALVFIWVSWSEHARKARVVVEKLFESWNSRHPDLPVRCYLADLSEQEGEVWDEMKEWLEYEGRSADLLMFSGIGPLLWVRRGRIVMQGGPFEVPFENLEAASLAVWQRQGS
ncbi:MAG TPA: hypothetical protein VHR72_09655 [Gemmataceae bacterium]|jgi:hypothetical protein|nr:hypothetical protein [Gemmataceae bacterium]